MADSRTYIHPNASVNPANIGEGTRVWEFVKIFPEAIIGEYCNICDFSLIENKVSIGNRVTVKCGVYLWDGLIVGDDVFIGPNATFTNDLYPRSKKDFELKQTVIQNNATIGANATIICGVMIGRYSFIGAGAVVTKDIKERGLYIGNPAKRVGWVDDFGIPLIQSKDGLYYSKKSKKTFREFGGVLTQL